MDKKLLSMLSLCQKAGKLISGETSCEKAIQSGEVFLILLAGDCSGNTNKKFTNKSNYYKVPIKKIGTIEQLSHAVGKNNRAVFVVIDKNFADKIISLIN